MICIILTLYIYSKEGRAELFSRVRNDDDGRETEDEDDEIDTTLTDSSGKDEASKSLLLANIISLSFVFVSSSFVGFVCVFFKGVITLISLCGFVLWL